MARLAIREVVTPSQLPRPPTIAAKSAAAPPHIATDANCPPEHQGPGFSTEGLRGYRPADFAADPAASSHRGSSLRTCRRTRKARAAGTFCVTVQVTRVPP